MGHHYQIYFFKKITLRRIDLGDLNGGKEIP